MAADIFGVVTWLSADATSESASATTLAAERSALPTSEDLNRWFMTKAARYAEWMSMQTGN